ncbi:MAG: T9SS type A sorting domain-containing protein [bacterium]
MSAEANSFTFCNSTLISHNYLGDYLNGTVSPNGNLYSVEKILLKKFSDPNYFCSACSCYPFNGNHYSTGNIYGNELAGSMWTPYSMMKAHNLYRTSEKESDKLNDERIISCELLDQSGRIIRKYDLMEDFIINKNNKELPFGIYFLKITYDDGGFKIKKIVID